MDIFWILEGIHEVFIVGLVAAICATLFYIKKNYDNRF